MPNILLQFRDDTNLQVRPLIDCARFPEGGVGRLCGTGQVEEAQQEEGL